MRLIIENVTVRKGTRVITDVPSLNLGPCGMVAVVGPNGAGKSTLLKVLGGVEKPGGGTARFGDRDLLRMPGRDRARLIGFVPQYFTPHWNQRVGELLELAEEKSGAAPELFRDSVGEFGLNRLLDRGWDGLSGGERARVLLAMALGGNPPLVLADEPGAAMDVRHNLDMLSSLRKRSAGSLVLVAIHDLNLAVRFFSRIVVLSEGRVAFDGPPARLLAERVLDAIFGVSFLRAEVRGGFLLYPEDAREGE
ncbi:MAG: ABC transporter ATP-binding protein [Deltaproteobacteria bacterium]|jgi:iron complex transport system ATP-binding protein|nr:ABC transporter ATP-binding protein [Deltaproteobacteria bacterium]